MSIAKTTYNRAIALRASYPLHKGIYKLRESADWLKRSAKNIDTMIGYHHSREGSKAFIACCWDDKSSWLKDIVVDVAHRLGYEILPGIEALKGDGLTMVNIYKIRTQTLTKIDLILDEVDRIHSLIKKQIDHEYAEWGKRRSPIKDVLIDTAILAENIATSAESRINTLQKTNKCCSQISNTPVVQTTSIKSP